MNSGVPGKVSAWIDRHPRPSLAASTLFSGLAYVLLIANVALVARGVGADSESSPHPFVLGLWFGLLNTVMAPFAWRREWRSIGLSSVDDWWAVTRSLRRGRAPADARLWWAADDLAERRSKQHRGRRLLGPILWLAVAVLFLVVDVQHPALVRTVGVLALLGAVLSAFEESVLYRRTQRAIAELQRCRPVLPPLPSVSPFR